MKLDLKIFHQIDPPSTTPFTLIETYRTSEGSRSRVVSGRWKSLDAAIAAREELLHPRSEGPHPIPKAEGYDPDEE